MNIDKNMMPSEKKFGKFFSFIFLGLFLYFYYYAKINLSIFFGTLGLITILLTFFASHYLKTFNLLWFRLGLFLNIIVSPVILGIIFFGIITPVSFFLKIIKRDELKLKSTNNSTFWKSRNQMISKNQNFKNQF